MMKIKNYVRVKSLDEAYELNRSRRNKIIGGMLWLKMTDLRVNTAIDLCDLGLDTMEETDTEFSVGCMCSLRALECHEGLNTYTNGAVRAALQDIVGVQFRNTATVGGTPYRFAQTVASFRGMVYTVTYTALEDVFDTHLCDYEQMLAAFDFRGN